MLRLDGLERSTAIRAYGAQRRFDLIKRCEALGRASATIHSVGD